MSHRTRSILACALALTLVLAVTPAAFAATPATSKWTTGSRPLIGRPQRAAALQVNRSSVKAQSYAPDGYEPDDEQASAQRITPGIVQGHTFTTATSPYFIFDVDYVWFTATAGDTYRVSAWDPIRDSNHTDTFMEFGDSDFTNVYMSNNDFEIAIPETYDSDIYWTCPSDGAGTYYIAVYDYSEDGRGGSYNLCVQDLGTVAPGIGHKVEGADRYAVARSVAYTANGGTWAGINRVIIASGLDRAAADPLAAGALAGVTNAPILLINQDSAAHVLPTPTKSAINAIHLANPGVDFYLVGGTASNPSWVQTKVQAITGTSGHTFTRLSGSDRYACAARIAREVRARSSSPPSAVLIANGETGAWFYDALAAAPISYAMGWPLLLTKKATRPSATSNEIAAGGYSAALVVGNTYEVKTSNLYGATRIGEPLPYYDRTRLARYVAEYAYNHSWFPRTHFVVANKLADALTGATLAGSLNAPMLFTENSTYTGDNLADYAQQCRPVITTWYTIGGPPSISSYIGYDLSYLTGNTGP